MSHEPEQPPASPPTTPAAPPNAKEKPPGFLGQVVTVITAVGLGLAALAWSVGPYLAPEFFGRLMDAVASHLWLIWVGLAAFVVLVLLGGFCWSALRSKK
jgi:hypothetical protein